MTPCQLFDGRLDVKGYGRVYLDGKYVKAHRLAWALHNGADPEGKVVRHMCHNPPCVNPEHLEIGTPRDNSRDMVTSGRSHVGTRNHNSKLTDGDVVKIRALSDGGMPDREAAKLFGVSHGCIGFIVRRESWTHV